MKIPVYFPIRQFHSLLPKNHLTKPTLPQFVVGVENGFLPRQEPLTRLPDEFKELESLLQKMPIVCQDGSKGLLSTGDFGNAVNSQLPEYNVDHITDTRLLTSLFRDYTFATSAYLLEPCDILFKKANLNGSTEYGIGRNKLPRNLAVPLSKIAQKIGASPFMEYAQSYALYNYQKINSKQDFTLENLKLIRSFSGIPSEQGFILVHVCMVAHTGQQVKHIINAISACEKKDRYQFDLELRGQLNAMQSINRVMDKMV